MNTKLLAPIILSLLIGTGIGYSISLPQIFSLQSETSRLESEISTMQTEYSDFNATYNQLIMGYSELLADYGLLQTSYESLNQTHETLQDTYELLEQWYEVLQIKCDSLNLSYYQLQQAYEQLEEGYELALAGSEIRGVYFSPNGGCEQAVINWIEKANSSVFILIYSFTLDSIGDALVDAHNRNIDVKVVFEKSQISGYSEYQRLKSNGVDVRNDTNSRSMHNKVMVVDGQVVLTGSFNWSANGEERNNENLIVVYGNHTANLYGEEFWKVWNTSI